LPSTTSRARRQPLRLAGLEGTIDLDFGDLLHGQVEMAAGRQRPVQVGQHQRPVLRRHVLHRIEAHGGGEGVHEGQLLQAALHQGDGDVPPPRLRQHPARLIHAHD
jgi:hypothetical protein